MRAINEASALVLVLSGAAMASEHVSREVERAGSKHKPIVAFRVDAANLSAELEYFLSRSQWIDVPALGMAGALVKLVEAVGQGSGSSDANRGLGGASGRASFNHAVGTASVAKRIVVAAAIVVAVIALPAAAASAIYRCIKDGQTVLTDKPCDVPAAASSAEAAGNQAAATESIVGQWRGQTQFQGAENGRELQEVHSVVPLVLTFSADGKVSGASADNGCTLLGLWAPGVTPRLFNLDVTLSECRYAGLNRRYTGTVVTAQIDQSAQFTLMVYTVPIPGIPLRRYDVEATLRR